LSLSLVVQMESSGESNSVDDQFVPNVPCPEISVSVGIFSESDTSIELDPLEDEQTTIPSLDLSDSDFPGQVTDHVPWLLSEVIHIESSNDGSASNTLDHMLANFYTTSEEGDDILGAALEIWAK